MIRKIAISTAIGLATVAAADPGAEPFTSYYSFGDSLTDDGKFGALAPPSLEGRFSSGPTYAEYIADIFKAADLDTANLAVGGATAIDPINDADLQTPLSSFDAQLDVFLSHLAFGTPLLTQLSPALELDFEVAAPGANPLTSVLFGANDLFALLDNDAIVDSVEQAAVEAAADAVTDGISRLATQSGGLFNDFLVLDLPDLGLTPAFRFTEENDEATLASQYFNDRLEANLQTLESATGPFGGLNVMRFSLEDYFAGILDGSTVLPGVTDFFQPCTPNISEFTPANNCALVDPTLVTARLFVDGVHPNGQAHAALGNVLINDLSDQLPSPVPLPASMPLLLAGFGAMAVWGRRKRAA